MNVIMSNYKNTPENSGNRMPVMFIGHGNPMNAIESNEFTGEWEKIGQTIPVPRAILCISAHWETRGNYITAMTNPRTIHDFYGFPDQLFQVQYPAPGSAELAREIIAGDHKEKIEPDSGWGLDHGCWTILKHIYPKAGIPVIQLSLNYAMSPAEHYQFAKTLGSWRKKGILIFGSGNLVHNLRMVSWRNPEDAYPWAINANARIKELILKKDHSSLMKYKELGKDMELAVPTPEHYLPALYTLALQEEGETVSFFNDKTMMGSLSMTSFIIN